MPPSSYSDIMNRISRFQKADLTTLSRDQIKRRIGRLMHDHRIMPLSADIGILYRARVNRSGDSFNNVSDVWCPPPSFASQGRFNRAGESVFYATTPINAALWEVRPKAGDLITIAICSPRGDSAKLCVSHIGLYNFSGRKDSLYSGIPDLRNDPSFVSHLKSKNALRNWLLTDGFFSDLSKCRIEDRPGLYNATCHVGEILTIPDYVNALSYPSVASGMSALNFRLDRDTAERLYKIAELWEFRINYHFYGPDDNPAIHPGKLDTHAIKRSESISADGTINWFPNGVNIGPSELRNIPQRLGSKFPFLP